MNIYSYFFILIPLGPEQQELLSRGNSYIHQNFPNTDFIKTCKVMQRNSQGEHIRDLKSVEDEF
jgi:hypothetical protein